MPHADYADEGARERSRKRAQARHDEALGGPDAFDVLVALPYIRVPPDELKETMREAQERAEVAEQARVREKVDTWMKQASGS